MSAFIGLALVAVAAPLIKRFLTAPLRRWVRHGMKDSRLRTILLTPLGYTKKARDEAAMRAVMDDYHLLAPVTQKLRERDSTSKPTALSDRL
jgi:hypothetical protein